MECIFANFKFSTFHCEKLLVLFDQCVLGFNQDFNQGFFVQLFQCSHHRQATDKFGNQAITDQVFRLNVKQQFTNIVRIFLALDNGRKTDACSA